MYADTHCHLYLLEGRHADEVVVSAQAAGVSVLVNVGIDLASSAECVAGASPRDGVWAAVGIHPHNAIEATEHVLARLAVLASHPGVVGVGETGLDYFRDHSPPIRQQESFREHIRLAKDLDKALIVHCRDAHDDLLAILDDEGTPPRTVMHCFSGDIDFVQACVDRGVYMSFAGNVTFTNAAPLREAAAKAPVELLVTETDSPYLSPHPMRGQPNEPARVTLVVDTLAAIHGLTAEQMAQHTCANARRLFALPDAS